MSKPTRCEKCGNEEFETLKSTAPHPKVKVLVHICTSCKSMVFEEG